MSCGELITPNRSAATGIRTASQLPMSMFCPTAVVSLIAACVAANAARMLTANVRSNSAIESESIAAVVATRS